MQKKLHYIFTWALNTSLTGIFICIFVLLNKILVFNGLFCWTPHLDKQNFLKKYFRIWQNSKSYHIAMYLYMCRVSEITPRGWENFIASRRTWNFSHDFNILLYHCTQINKRNKRKTMKFFLFLQKKPKITKKISHRSCFQNIIHK